MAYLFRHKGWNPIEVYRMSPGEKDVLKAFVLHELEDPLPAPACPFMAKMA